MKVRRKSLHRSANAKRAKKMAAMRAAKERKRLVRLAAEPTLPDTAHTYRPPPLAPLFVVTIRCRDGERVQLRLFENLHGRGLTPSATLAARKIAAVLTHYRPTP